MRDYAESAALWLILLAVSMMVATTTNSGWVIAHATVVGFYSLLAVRFWLGQLREAE